MKKLKERIYTLLNIIKNSIEKFPVSIISIFILTVIYAINLDNNFIEDITLINITLFIIIFTSATFLIETLSRKKIKGRMIYYVISAVWSFILTKAVNVDGNIFGMENEIFLYRIWRLISCFIILSVILGIYYNYKNSKKNFEEYVTKTLVGLFKASLVYSILAIGIAIVSAIFIYLILSGKSYILIARMEILLLGIYYIPTMIYTFCNQEEEIGKFTKIIIKYILGTLVIVSFLIIYMYILKLIILRNIPSNQIFRILSALFLYGLPVWTMSQYLQENNGYYDKINNKLPILFIPFIFLQIYSIGVRIIENGFTEARYLCVMLILFEIIYIIIYLKNKVQIGKILIVFVFITIISTIVPYINMFNVSNLSQANNLKIYTRKSEYTDKEKTKIYGAYRYLKNSVQGKKYIKDILTEDDEEKIQEFYDNGKYKQDYTKSINIDNNLGYIEIEGYKRLYNIKASDYSYENKIIDDFNKTKFIVEGRNKTIEIDMEELVKQWINKGEKLEDHFNELDEIIIDNSRKIIFSNIYIRYDKNTSRISSYSLVGYLLEK